MNERIQLSDDGTMDTVLVCKECGAEARYNFALSEQCDDAAPGDKGEAYDAFVEWAVEDFDSEHECSEPPDAADLGEL